MTRPVGERPARRPRPEAARSALAAGWACAAVLAGAVILYLVMTRTADPVAGLAWLTGITAGLGVAAFTAAILLDARPELGGGSHRRDNKRGGSR